MSDVTVHSPSNCSSQRCSCCGSVFIGISPGCSPRTWHLRLRLCAVVDVEQAGRVHLGVALGRGEGGVAEQFLNRRSEEHTSELQSLMRISYAVLCLKKKTKI